MKTLLAFLAILLCCSQMQAQNVEGQIIASQFGEYQVPTIGNGFAFPPASCQVTGGNKNFPAFTVGVPIKAVDTNPAHIEVDTPVAVNLSNNTCSVSMTTTYSHSSFYLTSGTGGLQEALDAGQVTGGNNTVILNQQWYALVYEFSKHIGTLCVRANKNVHTLGAKLDPMLLLRMINGREAPTKAVIAALAEELHSDVRYLEKLAAEIKPR
jgi:hypothetical protein